jgi:glutathione S-transferase
MKPLILLEELGLPYTLIPVDLKRGEQKEAAFSRLNPAQHIPVIRDDSNDLTLVESGAILLYLAEKTRRLLPADPRERALAYHWFFSQITNVDPCGRTLATLDRLGGGSPELTEGPIQTVRRFWQEAQAALEHADYLGGSYSIADIVAYTFVRRHGVRFGFEDFGALVRWAERVRTRPAVQAAYGKFPAS